MRVLTYALFSCLLSATVHGNPTEVPDRVAAPVAAARANNKFTLDLYGRLSRQPGNLVVSAYGISTALSMVRAGVTGDVATRFDAILGRAGNGDRADDAPAALAEVLNRNGAAAPAALTISNHAWYQKGLRPAHAFADELRQGFRAGLSPLDFSGDPVAAGREIDRWISDHTSGRITDLVRVGQIDAATVFFLANAVHFNAAWRYPFALTQTRESEFTLADGQSALVPFMHGRAIHPYYENGTLQLLCLPYAPRDEEHRVTFSLVILLPRPGVSVEDLERKLALADLNEWLRQSVVGDDEDPRLKAWERRQPPDDADENVIRKWIEEHPVKEVDVRLPRFSVTSRFSLEGALSAMGLPLDLGPDARFSDPPESFRPRLAPIAHKAMIRVDEAGTEAAAGTGVGLFGGPMAGPATFNANRPFLFLIRHNASEAILFMGRLVDPRNEAAP